MSPFQNWFWEIERCRQGPDYYFNASFAPSDAERLADVIRQHPLPDFLHYRFVGNLTNAPCGKSNEHGSYDLYIDRNNYAEVISGLISDQPRIQCAHCIWDIICVCGCFVAIECGYGGVLGTHNQAETSLIVALAQSKQVTLQYWGVVSGGDGYGPVYFRTGTSATELLTYLQTKEPTKPDFTQIETELRLALSEPKFAQTYRLGKCKIQGWQFQAIILHEIQKNASHAWDMAPHAVLNEIAYTVSQKCQVPGYVGGAAHDPNDFYTLIGSSITFGYPL
ncbi:MAG: hypothetical protein SAL70_26325 [Scytonema sp. PMC 1070.18]|nr:hypothetical protein [Scytonema sp. PMC 1070.18]